MKQCMGCGEQKPFTEFHRMQRSPDGYRPRCKQCRKAETTENYVANRERIKARSKAWREDNPERYKKLLHDWGVKNRDRKNAMDRQWRENNRERHRAMLKAYQRANPQNARNQRARRRAQIGATVHRITKDEWQALKEKYNGCCAYCGAPTKNPTMDHVVALKRGGHHTVDNIVPACGPCNREKSTQSVVDFLARRASRVAPQSED